MADLYLQQTVVILLAYHHRTAVLLLDEGQKVFCHGHIATFATGNFRILRTLNECSVNADIHIYLVVPCTLQTLKLEAEVVVCGRLELLGVFNAPLTCAVFAGESSHHHLRNEAGVVAAEVGLGVNPLV